MKDADAEIIKKRNNLKTCFNCKYYHPILIDKDTTYHIHDYCAIWQTRIPDHVVYNDEGYSAIECGVAECFAFKEKENTFTNLNAEEK